MNERARERLLSVDARHLAVACRALVQRLRVTHQAFDAGDRATRIACVCAHDELVEALLNLLSVVECADPGADVVQRLRAGLEKALVSARERGFEAFSG